MARVPRSLRNFQRPISSRRPRSRKLPVIRSLLSTSAEEEQLEFELFHFPKSVKDGWGLGPESGRKPRKQIRPQCQETAIGLPHTSLLWTPRPRMQLLLRSNRWLGTCKLLQHTALHAIADARELGRESSCGLSFRCRTAKV